MLRCGRRGGGDRVTGSAFQRRCCAPGSGPSPSPLALALALPLSAGRAPGRCPPRGPGKGSAALLLRLFSRPGRFGAVFTVEGSRGARKTPPRLVSSIFADFGGLGCLRVSGRTFGKELQVFLGIRNPCGSV